MGNNKSTTVNDVENRAAETIFECREYFNTSRASRTADYAQILLTKGCSDSEMVLLLQNVRLAQRATLSTRVQISDKKLGLQRLSKDTYDIREQKIRIRDKCMDQIQKMSDAHTKFDTDIADILTGPMTDSVKVIVMRNLMMT